MAECCTVSVLLSVVALLFSLLSVALVAINLYWLRQSNSKRLKEAVEEVLEEALQLESPVQFSSDQSLTSSCFANAPSLAVNPQLETEEQRNSPRLSLSSPSSAAESTDSKRASTVSQSRKSLEMSPKGTEVVGTFGYSLTGQSSAADQRESIYEILRRSRLEAELVLRANTDASAAVGDVPRNRWWYLPLKMNGVTVLVNTGGNMWQATNDALQSSAPGLSYRMSKSNVDRATENLPWGQRDVGIDEGDGWVRFSKDGEDCNSPQGDSDAPQRATSNFVWAADPDPTTSNFVWADTGDSGQVLSSVVPASSMVTEV